MEGKNNVNGRGRGGAAARRRKERRYSKRYTVKDKEDPG